MRRALSAGVAAIALVASAGAAAQQTVYPKTGAAGQSQLAAALGQGGYAVDDVGASEAFRAAVRRAVATHPGFGAGQAEIAKAKAEGRGARASLYPRLSTAINADYVIDRSFDTGTDNVVEALRPDGQVNGSVTVSQLVFDGGAAFARIRAARARSREASATLAAQSNQTTLEALSAYHDLAAHQAILALGADYIARHERVVRDVSERERRGAGSRADVVRAQARLSAAKARVAQIRESAAIAEIRYGEFFGAEAQSRLPFPSFEAVAVGSRDEAVALAEANDPLLKAAGARAEGARADLKAAKAARLPEVRANVSGVKYDLQGGDDYDVRAGVGLEYDLYAGGARGAEISAARAAADRQRFEEDGARLETKRNAAIAFERRKSTQSRLDALGEAVIANAEARDLVVERFRTARGELLDVLQAESDWFEAGAAYLAGLADRDMAHYELMEFTGDLARFFAPESLAATPEVVASQD